MRPAPSTPDHAARRSQRFETAATFVAAVVLSWPFWRPDRLTRSFDNVVYSAPNLEFTLHEWRAGRVPLWNDAIFGGVSHLGNTQTGSLYPARLLVLGLRADRGIDLLVALHLVLLMLSMRWLVKRLGLLAPAGFVAAIGVGASGAFLVKTIQFEQFLVLAWAPLLLITAHGVVTSIRPWRAAAAFGATAAAATLAGHPQMTFLIGCLLAAWLAGWLTATRAWRRLIPLATGSLLAGLTGALQLFATAHAVGVSAIGQNRRLSDLMLPDRSVMPQRLWSVLFGTVRNVDPAAFSGGFESVGFIGTGLFTLAIVGGVAVWRDRSLRPVGVALAGAAFIATLLALGSRTIVYRAAWHLVPLFDLPRVPARWLDVTTIVAALLAAYGIDAVRRASTGRTERIAVMVAAAVVVVTTATGLTEVTLGWRTAAWWIVLAGAVVLMVRLGRVSPRGGRLSTVVIVALVLLELGVGWSRGAPLRPSFTESITTASSPTTELLRGAAGFEVAFTDDAYGDAGYLVPGLRPNANALNDIRSIDGYDGGVQVTKRWLSIILRSRDTAEFELPLRNQLIIPLDPAALARINVRWVLLDRARSASDHVAGWDEVGGDDRFTLWENPLWRSEATLWFETAEEPDAVAAAARLRRDPPGTDTTAIVEPGRKPLECRDVCAPVAVGLTRVNARELRVHTDSAQAAVLSVGSQYDDGWQVSIDGVSTDPLPVDGVMLGAIVPPGSHDVRFVYRPGWLAPGVVLSLLGLLGLLALAVLEPRYHRRRGRGDAVHHG